MDKKQGEDVAIAYGKAVLSVLADVATVFSGGAAIAGKASGIVFTSLTAAGTAATLWDNTLATTMMVADSSDQRPLGLRAIDAYMPIWSTIKDFQKAKKISDYTPDFVPQ